MIKISNYQIFFDLRDNYPSYCNLISEIMKYSFSHKDSLDETTYLNGFFDEDDIKFIFEQLELRLKVLSIIKTNHRNIPQTIIMFGVEDDMNSVC